MNIIASCKVIRKLSYKYSISSCCPNAYLQATSRLRARVDLTDHIIYYCDKHWQALTK